VNIATLGQRNIQIARESAVVRGVKPVNPAQIDPVARRVIFGKVVVRFNVIHDQAARIGTSRHTETDVLSRRILRQLSNNGHAFDILDGGLEAGLHRIAGLREVNLQLRLTYVEQTWNQGQSR